LLFAANLALDLGRLERFHDAARFRDMALLGLRSLLGAEHPETINIERGRRAEVDIDVPPL
jgi:hypothetical protein